MGFWGKKGRSCESYLIIDIQFYHWNIPNNLWIQNNSLYQDKNERTGRRGPVLQHYQSDDRRTTWVGPQDKSSKILQDRPVYSGPPAVLWLMVLQDRTGSMRGCCRPNFGGPEGSTQVLQRSSDWGCAGPPVLCSGPSLVFWFLLQVLLILLIWKWS